MKSDETENDRNLTADSSLNNSYKANKSDTCWFSASEVAGLPDCPTTARRARDLLERLVGSNEHLKRRRKGTKGFEYHLSILPIRAQEVLANRLNSQSELIQPDAAIAFQVDGHLDRSPLDDFVIAPVYQLWDLSELGNDKHKRIIPSCFQAYRRDWLKERGLNIKDIMVVCAKGDSMEPTIHNDDFLVCNLNQRKLLDGNIYLFKKGVHLLVKRFQNVLGAWNLISDNLAYDKLNVSADEQKQFEVVGQIVRISRDI